jgi:hypothetical protein
MIRGFMDQSTERYRAIGAYVADDMSGGEQ